MGKIVNIFILIFLICCSIEAQTKTNIEKIYTLVGNSVEGVVTAKAGKVSKILIEYASPEAYSMIKNSVIEKTASLAKVTTQKENADFIFAYSVEEAKVKYGECFTKSFLGRNYVEREISLKGFAGINNPGGIISTGRFSLSEKDTVEYRNLKELGSAAIPFTNPEIPSEPFFSSIWEPVIAVGVAVTTIYLLFTVRSK